MSKFESDKKDEPAISDSTPSLEKIRTAIERSALKRSKSVEEIAFERKHGIVELQERDAEGLVSIRTWQEKLEMFKLFHEFAPSAPESELELLFSPEIIAMFIHTRTNSYVTAEDLEEDWILTHDICLSDEVTPRLIDEDRYFSGEASYVDDLEEPELSDYLSFIDQIDQWIKEQDEEHV